MWEAFGIITVSVFAIIGFATICFLVYEGLIK